MSDRTEVHHVHLHFCNKYGSMEVGWETTASPCTVVRWRVRIHSVLCATVANPCFCNATGSLSLSARKVSLSADGLPPMKVGGPDAKVELTVGGVIVSIAQHTEGRGESGNAMLDLSVSGLASVVGPRRRLVGRRWF